MAGDRSTVEQREEALLALLATPHALFAALSDNGFRVPLLAPLGLPEEQLISAPTDPATMVDLLIPGEAMKAITAWERADVSGMAFTEVHALADPGRLLTLSLIDMRDRCDVMLAVLSPALPMSESLFSSDLTGSEATTVRPRTGTMLKSKRAVLLEIDDRACRMLGWAPGQMLGKRSLEFIHPDDHDRVLAAWLDLLAKEGSHRVRSRHRRGDGSWLWLEVEHTWRAPAGDGESPTVTAQLTDISDEMKAHEDLGRRERLFRRLAESLPVGVLQIDAQKHSVYVNHRLAAIIGASAPPSLDELLATIVDGSRGQFDSALEDALNQGSDHELEIRIRPSATEEIRTVSANIVSLGQGEGVPGALCCFTDITEGARLREELRARASFDMLTGCHNRATVLAFLSEHVAGGGMVAVIFVDLDDFKPVNDRLGHEAGDELLVHTAHRLKVISEGRGMIGRLGGDEFLVVVTEMQSQEEALVLADRINVALRESVTLSAGTVALSASVGVACSRPGEDAKALVKRADTAMYLAKSQVNRSQGAPTDRRARSRR